MELDCEETNLLKQTLRDKYKSDLIEIENCLREHYSALIHKIITENHAEICPLCVDNMCDMSSAGVFLCLGSAVFVHATQKQMFDTWKSFTCDILDSFVLRKAYFKWIKNFHTVESVVENDKNAYYMMLITDHQ